MSRTRLFCRFLVASVWELVRVDMSLMGREAVGCSVVARWLNAFLLGDQGWLHHVYSARCTYAVERVLVWLLWFSVVSCCLLIRLRLVSSCSELGGFS